jgi:hypothetical protein
MGRWNSGRRRGAATKPVHRGLGGAETYLDFGRPSTNHGHDSQGGVSTSQPLPENAGFRSYARTLTIGPRDKQVSGPWFRRSEALGESPSLRFSA